MNLQFIKRLIDAWYISSAQGRLIESWLVALFLYLMQALISQEMVSWNAALIAFFMPFYLYYTKKQRDKQNLNTK